MNSIFDYPVIDAHCDTLTAFDTEKETLFDSKTHFNASKQLMYPRFTQVMDIWVDSASHETDARVDRFIDEFYVQLETVNKRAEEQGASIGQILEHEDLDKYRYAWMLAVEGGECIDSDAGRTDTENEFQRLRELYRRGVRLITLTWNTPNAISDTNRNARPEPGLTKFGRAVVKEMNRLGMTVDLSHISDRGFWDTLEVTGKPVVASHSDARALASHSRNLTDEMFEALVKNGGVCGVNFCTAFLGGSADVDMIIKHIEHFAVLGGIANIGIGADFDGIDELPGGIDGTESLYKIFDRLLQMNYTDSQVTGIAEGNFRRVLCL